MQLDYWKKRWKDNQTGWHHDAPHPKLLKYHSTINLPDQAHVLLPLSGMTHDIDWLASKGHQVTCVEASSIAIERVRQRLDITWTQTRMGPFDVFKHQNITIYQGNFFDLPSIELDPIDLSFDRAAFVAIEPPKRKQYAHVYQKLQPKYTLMVLYQYDQKASTAPPFSFQPDEMQQWLEKDYQITVLEEEDILEQFEKFKERGVTFFYRRTFLLQSLVM